MKTLLLSTFLMIQLFAFSQEWTTFYTDNVLSIEYAKKTFNDPVHNHIHERIVFRYTNLTSEQVHFSYDRMLSYDGVELPQSPERHFELILSPNEIKSYNEAVMHDKLYYIFHKDVNGMIKSKLSFFDIINIQYL